jgi:hypothetical protein
MEEAARRTRDDADDQVEWIYLRDAAGQWVARRVQRHPIVENEEGFHPWWESLLEALFYLWH